MIDWFNVFANALWIFALALALATLSFARWEAVSQGRKIREVLAGHGWQTALNIAGGFFCAGLAATSDALWERVIWLLLLASFVVQIGMTLKTARKQYP